MNQSDDIVLNVRIRAFAYSGGANLSLPSFTLRRGQAVVLTGRSGSGKSTLLHLVAGVQALSSEQGSIRVESVELSGTDQPIRDRLRPQTVGWMPQRVHLISALSVFDNVMLPYRFGHVADDPNAVESRARALMETLEIGSLAAARVTQISVGQASRVCATRALAVKPTLLCADEPSAALDQRSTLALARVFAKYVADGGAALIASHDHALLEALQEQLGSLTTIALGPDT